MRGPILPHWARLAHGRRSAARMMPPSIFKPPLSHGPWTWLTGRVFQFLTCFTSYAAGEWEGMKTLRVLGIATATASLIRRWDIFRMGAPVLPSIPSLLTTQQTLQRPNEEH